MKHAVTATIRGAGTNDVSYVVACSCGWHHEDYSAMSAYDRGTVHAMQAGRDSIGR